MNKIDEIFVKVLSIPGEHISDEAKEHAFEIIKLKKQYNSGDAGAENKIFVAYNKLKQKISKEADTNEKLRHLAVEFYQDDYKVDDLANSSSFNKMSLVTLKRLAKEMGFDFDNKRQRGEFFKVTEALRHQREADKAQDRGVFRNTALEILAPNVKAKIKKDAENQVLANYEGVVLPNDGLGIDNKYIQFLWEHLGTLGKDVGLNALEMVAPSRYIRGAKGLIAGAKTSSKAGAKTGKQGAKALIRKTKDKHGGILSTVGHHSMNDALAPIVREATMSSTEDRDFDISNPLSGTLINFGTGVMLNQASKALGRRIVRADDIVKDRVEFQNLKKDLTQRADDYKTYKTSKKKIPNDAVNNYKDLQGINEKGQLRYSPKGMQSDEFADLTSLMSKNAQDNLDKINLYMKDFKPKWRSSKAKDNYRKKATFSKENTPVQNAQVEVKRKQGLDVKEGLEKIYGEEYANKIFKGMQDEIVYRKPFGNSLVDFIPTLIDSPKISNALGAQKFGNRSASILETFNPSDVPLTELVKSSVSKGWREELDSIAKNKDNKDIDEKDKEILYELYQNPKWTRGFGKYEDIKKAKEMQLKYPNVYLSIYDSYKIKGDK